MDIMQKSRWVGAAIVAVGALVGANSAATTRTIEAGLQVRSGFTCSNPPTGIYATFATGTASGVLHCNVLAPVAPVGITSFSQCDSSVGSATMNLHIAGGTVASGTLDFTSAVTGSTVSWQSGHTASTSFSGWDPATNCILDGQAQGVN